MRYIEQLREGDMVQEIYLCKVKSVLKTKAGKTYYSLQLQDKSGMVDGKIWDLNNAISHFDSMNYVSLTGEVTSFNGTNQLNIKRIRVAQEGEYDPADYIPCSENNVEEMYNEILSLIDNIQNQYLNKLMKSFFVDDIEFIGKFKFHSAAKSIHHGFVGGLVEHSLSVAKLCEFIANRYEKVNKDLVVATGLLHDIGKVIEISPFPENDYTDEGQLLGHLYIGAEMISNKIKKIDGFPKSLENQVKHCILAHHGKLEFGSPKKPSIIEAVVLSYADELDAKVQTFSEILKATPDTDEWIGYNRLFENNLRVTDV